MATQPDSDIGIRAYMRITVVQHPGTGRPLLDIGFSEPSDDIKARLYNCATSR